MVTCGYEKTWESVPVTRPTPRGSRIAHSSLNEQRRSPRWYAYIQSIQYTIPIGHYTIGTGTVCLQNIPIGIYCCFVFDHCEEFARFRGVKNKASSKRFPYIYVPTHPPAQTGISAGTCVKKKKKITNKQQQMSGNNEKTNNNYTETDYLMPWHSTFPPRQHAFVVEDNTPVLSRRTRASRRGGQKVPSWRAKCWRQRIVVKEAWVLIWIKQ